MVQKVLIIGQGYVGLPLAMRAVEVGFQVHGIDVDARRIDSLRNGNSYVEDIPSEKIQNALKSGRFHPEEDYSNANDFDFAIITVPTPLLNGVPDLSFVEQAGKFLAPFINEGCTIILESTTYPGTTENLLVPILELQSSLRAGIDFYIGYSPERIDPGNKTWNIVNTPKVIAGLNQESLNRVKNFYDQLVTKTIPVSGLKEAELSKLLENTFRHVNIALVNEFAVFARKLGVDIQQVVEAASSKPFGFMKFTPGPGVGGHCLPVDPSYLSWQVFEEFGESFRFIELANDINDQMPFHVVERIEKILQNNSKTLQKSKILILGIAYKQNSGDIRNAPSVAVLDQLNRKGAFVSGLDPHVADSNWPQNLNRVTAESLILSDFDLAVILTHHDDLDLKYFEAAEIPVLDTHGLIEGRNFMKL